MDLKQLQYFVVSVDSGSLKKAAETLYTSQPHISKTLKSLEAELQVELLIRKARGVEVTEAGKKVYEHACRILVESGQIQNIRESRTDRMLTVIAHSNSRLEKLFQRFYTEKFFGVLQVRYLQGSMEEIFQCIHRHTAELGFVHVDLRQMTAFRQTLEYRHLEFVKLSDLQPLLYAGPSSPLYAAEIVTNKDLQKLQYVQMKDEQDSLSIHLFQGSEDYRRYRSRGQVLTTDSRPLLIQMLLTTTLCSISCGLSEEDGGGRLRGIPIRGTNEAVAFGYIRRKRDGLSKEAEAFTEYVREYWKS